MHKTYLIHKITALITVTALILGLFSFIAFAQESVLPFSELAGEEAARAAFTINGIPLSGGSTIDAPADGSDFRLTASLSFHISAEKIPYAIAPGTCYQLEIPSILLPADMDFVLTQPFQITDEDRSLALGTLTFSSEGIFLTFDYPDSYFKSEDGLLDYEKVNTYLSMLSNIRDCRIDFSWPKPQAELNASRQENVDLDIYGESTTLHFSQYAPSKVGLVKSAQADRDDPGLIHWCAELTTGSLTDEGLLFADIFPNQSYVEGSLRINGTMPSEDLILDTMEEGRFFLTFQNALSSYAANEKILLTYSTRAADSAYAAAYMNGGTAPDQIYLVNTACLRDLDAVTPIVSDNASISLPAGWLNKQGKFDPQTRTVTWTLILNETERSLTDVILDDTMGAGLVLEEGTFEISTDGILYAPLPFTPEIVRSDNYEAQGDKFHIVLGEIPQKTYIRYVTRVIDSFYFPSEGTDQSGNAQNRTQLTFSFRPESGGGWDNAVFVTEPAKVLAGIAPISKSADYNSANHTITWTLTANNARAALQKGIITDIIQPGQTYVPDSVTIRYSDLYVETALFQENRMEFYYDETEQKLTFLLGNTLNQRVAVITYQTRVDDPLDWAYNNSDVPTQRPAYSNTALFDAKLDGEDVTGLASAVCYIPSNVLRKHLGRYDYQTKTIACTLTVNENRMPMPDGIIQDTFETGLSLNGPLIVTGTDTVTEIPSGSEGARTPYYTYDENLRTLEIILGPLADNRTLTISYPLAVDVTHYGIKNLQCETDFMIKNTATLTRADYPQPVSAEAGTPPISSSVLDKAGSLNPTEGTIEYHILINKLGVDLSSLGTPCTLTDTISSHALLDLGSIKLYRVSISPDGSPLIGSETEMSLETYSCSYTPGIHENTLKLTLPADTGTASYLLVYSAFILHTGNTIVENSISLNGQPPQASGHESLEINIAHGSTLGWSQKKAVISIQSVDPEGKALAGAEFTLYDENGREIAKAVSNEDGMVLFIVDPNGNYTVRETKAPAGYRMSQEWKKGKRITRVDSSNQYLWEDGSSTSRDIPAIAPHSIGEEPSVSPAPNPPAQYPSGQNSAGQSTPSNMPDQSPLPDEPALQNPEETQEDGNYFISPQTGDMYSGWTVLFIGFSLAFSRYIGIRKFKKG
ncbi:MAG: hypothetical protein J1E65_05875 [Lachnospiraceae bacterium]|nr:hypothetical protein [Lachnospiraceae bacterium]